MYMQVDDRFFIYLEYVHPGSINKYVHEHCGAMTEAVVRSFTRHILSGLAYLHSTKTIHRYFQHEHKVCLAKLKSETRLDEQIRTST